MIRLLSVLVLAVTMVLGAERALAQGRRVALVVGVSAYQNVARLPNATNDANAMADLFRKAGFDVVSARSDLTNLEFKRSIREFEDAVVDADIAVIFYAGHGIEVRESNFLIPTDAKLLNERDVEDEAIALDRMILALEPAKRLRLIILDACRDNPFAGKMKRRVATRAMSTGLAKVEPAMSDTLIAYAAKDNSVAADGDGEHSPFTTALLRNLTEPGLDVRLAFGRVRDEVKRATNQRQEPYVYGSLGGGTVSLVALPEKPAAPVVSIRSDQAAKSDYEIVERVAKREAWEVFLNTHKTGLYADLARVQLAKLSESDSVVRTAVPGGVPDAPARIAPTAPLVPSVPKPSPEEQRAWDRVRNSPDRAAVRQFLDRYPTSLLAGAAQDRLEALDRQARERQETLRAEREAREQREEETRRTKAAEADRKRLEREAAKQRETEEQAKVAEAARQKAEMLAAAKQREAEERARLAEALAKQREEERVRAAAVLAEQREAEQKQKAAEAERLRIQREAILRQQEERARAAADAMIKEQLAAQDQKAAERLRTEQALAAQREADERAKVAEAARQKLEREAARQREADDNLQVTEAAREAERQTAANAAALVQRRKAAEAAQAAEQRRAEREAAAEARERAEEARRTAETDAAASRRKAADLARRAAERQAERAEAAADRRRREARAAKEVAQTRVARPAPQQQARPQVVAAPRAAPRASGGAASMVGIGF